MILPINPSRSHHLLIVTEYFIDQEKYFYLIQFHFIASSCIGTIVTLAVGTMLITYLQHTSGMFKIARCGRKNTDSCNSSFSHDYLNKII